MLYTVEFQNCPGEAQNPHPFEDKLSVRDLKNWPQKNGSEWQHRDMNPDHRTPTVALQNAEII